MESDLYIVLFTFKLLYKEILLIIEILLEGEKINSSLVNVYFTFWPKCCLLFAYSTVLWGHSTCLVGEYVICWSQLFLLYIVMLCYYACTVLLTLFACAHYDRAIAWHHWENTIKGGSSFLFTIGNADFELNTSVILSASGNILFS